MTIATAQVPLTCRTADDERFVRYDPNSDALEIVSWQTGDVVRVLEESAGFAQTVEWSPGCAYVLTHSPSSGAFELYSPQQSEAIGTLPGQPTRITRVSWHPNHTHFILQTASGAYLWNITTGQKTLLSDVVDVYGRSLYSVDWRGIPGQLLLVKMGAINEVHAHDLTSGNLLAIYGIGERAGPVQYQFDGRWMVLYTSHRETLGDNRPQGIAVWNIATRESYQLDFNIEYWGTSNDDIQLLLSPDERYIVVNNYRGLSYKGLFVWDSENFEGEAPYTPQIHRIRIETSVRHGGWQHMRWMDNGLLEIATVSIFPKGPPIEKMGVIRFDITTNEIVERVDDIGDYENCGGFADVEVEQATFDWICGFVVPYIPFPPSPTRTAEYWNRTY
ncbi:MAG: WD40 repeat domain-containing protein [Chloroflexota bacterium]